MINFQQQLQKPASISIYTTTKLNQPIDLLTGVGLAVLVCPVTFAVSFCLAHVNGLTSGNYPEVAANAAAIGLALCLLSGPIALDVSRRSVQTMAALSTVAFWILGLLTSLAV